MKAARAEKSALLSPDYSRQSIPSACIRMVPTLMTGMPCRGSRPAAITLK
jgi:hypothetical protein